MKRIALIIGITGHDGSYLAAQSHVQVSFDAPDYSGDVDVLGVLRTLEVVRILDLKRKLKYIKLLHQNYMEKWKKFLRETAPFHPYLFYVVAKQYGFGITKEYREAYEMFAVMTI